MGEQDAVARRVLNSLAITAGLVWLPSVAKAGITATGVD
jgi:hypothetical protein